MFVASNTTIITKIMAIISIIIAITITIITDITDITDTITTTITITTISNFCFILTTFSISRISAEQCSKLRADRSKDQGVSCHHAMVSGYQPRRCS